MADPILVPINHVSTAKQALFDVILGQKTLGPIPPYLVKGDYDIIYKMMVNREMILGATVECYDNGHQTVHQWLETDFKFVDDKTVGSKPVIAFKNYNGNYCYIDCNNIIYRSSNGIPFDGEEDDSGEGGQIK